MSQVSRNYKKGYKTAPSSLRAKVLAQRRSAATSAVLALARATPKRSPMGAARGGPIGEKKVIDIITANYVFEASGVPPTPILLNGCIAGSQNYNRIGRKTHVTSLQFRGMIVPVVQGVATDDQFCRMVIVYDKQSNSANPTWANIMQSQSIAGTTSSGATDMVNLDNRDRFTIIRDKCYAMSYMNVTATTAQAGSNTIEIVEEYITLNLEVIFNAGSAGTIGDIQTGGLYAFFVGSGAQNYAWNGSFRTRFIDM